MDKRKVLIISLLSTAFLGVIVFGRENITPISGKTADTTFSSASESFLSEMEIETNVEQETIDSSVQEKESESSEQTLEPTDSSEEELKEPIKKSEIKVLKQVENLRDRALPESSGQRINDYRVYLTLTNMHPTEALKKIKIEDELSDYVDFLSESNSQVTQIVNQQESQLPPTAYQISLDKEKKQVTVEFNQALVAGVSYTVSFEVTGTPLAMAETIYMLQHDDLNNQILSDKETDRKELNTVKTGFPISVNSYVSWGESEEREQVDFPHPVIQYLGQ